MMKKISLLWVWVLLSSNVFAQNTQIQDEFDKTDTEQLELLQSNFQFQAFESCQSMNEIFADMADKYAKHYPIYYRGGPMPLMMEDAMDADFAAEESLAVTSKVATQGATAPWDDGGANTEFTTTNLQKKWVDEPDISKSDGDHIYYYSQQEKKVYIMKTPLNVASATVDFDRTKIESEIVIPQSMHQVQMFLAGDKLVLVGSRNTNYWPADQLLNRSARSVAIVFDISDAANPDLVKFHDIDGHVNNMRMIDDQLYLLTQLSMNWHYFSQLEGEEREIKMQATDMSLPKIYSLDSDKNLDVHKTDCSQVSYVLPTDETLEETRLFPQFTMISKIDIEDHEVDTTVAFGNAGKIHMSLDSLYIAQYQWIPQAYYATCPAWMPCIWPRFEGGQYTLIHKFDLNGNGSDNALYENSNLVPGSLLNQYSMDEGPEGRFRILTSIRRDQQATNLYVLNKDLELEGKLENIEPGEQFKASRYIGDKLYLVTFRQTDPLFVIDMEDASGPEIIGELKIPGFSTYLHPMGGIEDGKQYLIGLGHAADVNGRMKGLQVSFVEVDYEEPATIQTMCGWLAGDTAQYESCKKDFNPDHIRVTQIDAMTLGDQGSRSEATTNPRMFVINSDNEVTLPMLLKELKTWSQNCNIIYDENGNEIDRDCRDITQYVTTFAGLKSFDFDKQSGISESKSVDYQELIAKTVPSFDNYYRQGVESRQLRQLMMRVGNLGDQKYTITNDFAHFFNDEEQSFLYFDGLLTGDPVTCANLEQEQCDANPMCESMRGAPDCDGDICVEIAIYQGCKERQE